MVDPVAGDLVSRWHLLDLQAKGFAMLSDLTCSHCGEGCHGRQWWNQDTGYSCCWDCAERWFPVTNETHGERGYNYGISPDEAISNARKWLERDKAEHDKLPLLHGVEHLRINCHGYVFWKYAEIDHWSGSLLEDSERSRSEARRLAERCLHLESLGVPVNSVNVVWRWEQFAGRTT